LNDLFVMRWAVLKMDWHHMPFVGEDMISNESRMREIRTSGLTGRVKKRVMRGGYWGAGTRRRPLANFYSPGHRRTRLAQTLTVAKRVSAIFGWIGRSREPDAS